MESCEHVDGERRAKAATRAILYYHFSGKSAIYTTVVCEMLLGISAGIRQLARAFVARARSAHWLGAGC